MLSDTQRAIVHRLANQIHILTMEARMPLAVEAAQECARLIQQLYEVPATTRGHKSIVSIHDQLLVIEYDDIASEPGEPLCVHIRKCPQCGTRFALLLKLGQEHANTQRFCKTRGDKCKNEWKAQKRKEGSGG